MGVVLESIFFKILFSFQQEFQNFQNLKICMFIIWQQLFFQILILNLRWFFISLSEKIEILFHHVKTGSVYPIPVLHTLLGSAKQAISLRYIYWAKFATLTAYHSQFRNNYFSISDLKNWKIFSILLSKEVEKIFFLCRTDTVTQYLFCTLLSGCAKKTISLRFIYWARSVTLTAYCSQFRNKYFPKNFCWLCQSGNAQILLYQY